MDQTTDSVLMVKPANFRSNEQTALNNYYQSTLIADNAIEHQAIEEFENLVDKLLENGINVIVCDQNDELNTPDAHFPNNWVSFHENGNLILYPMFAKNRRLERRHHIIQSIHNAGFISENTLDYSPHETNNRFLEGTGSIILDRTNRIAYAAISERTNERLFHIFCQENDFKPVSFRANQTVNNLRCPIYHTNVMMCIAETFAVICLDAIDDKKERSSVIESLKQSGKKIISITEKQVESFAGNMIQLKNSNNERLLVMSTQAFFSLNKQQIHAIEYECSIVHCSINTIEMYGGGSARCMIAEIFLPKKK